jgi:hypothetical protein
VADLRARIEKIPFWGWAILSSTGGSRYLTDWEVRLWKLGLRSAAHYDRKYFGV